jgi:hypothetical protein
LAEPPCHRRAHELRPRRSSVRRGPPPFQRFHRSADISSGFRGLFRSSHYRTVPWALINIANINGSRFMTYPPAPVHSGQLIWADFPHGCNAPTSNEAPHRWSSRQVQCFALRPKPLRGRSANELQGETHRGRIRSSRSSRRESETEAETTGGRGGGGGGALVANVASYVNELWWSTRCHAFVVLFAYEIQLSLNESKGAPVRN